jgi:hypothetical protein
MLGQTNRRVIIATLGSAAAWPLVGCGGGSNVSVPAYTFRASQQWATTTTSSGPLSVDLGPASADRLVIVGVSCSSYSGTPAVTVNGVSLTQQISDAGFSVAIFSGLVPAGDGVQTIIIDLPGTGYQDRGMSLWTATGLSSDAPSATACAVTNYSTDITINAASGFLFAFGRNAGGSGSGNTFNATNPSVAVPTTAHTTREDNIISTNSVCFFMSGDWASPNNSSFKIATETTSIICAAVYAA